MRWSLKGKGNFMNLTRDKTSTPPDPARPLSDMRERNGSMELPKEKAELKLKLEEESSVFVHVIAATDIWLKMVGSLPAHSYRGYEADVESFMGQGRTVQVQCGVLARQIDALQLCAADTLEEQIGDCWPPRGECLT